MISMYTKEDVDARMEEISAHLTNIINAINEIKIEVGLIEPHPATKGETEE